MNRITILISTYLVLLILTSILNYIKSGKFKISRFKYSTRNYYIMMSPYVLSLIIYALISKNIETLIFFSTFAVFGVIGEVIFSFLWDLLFDKRFWVYNTDSIINGYTSTLNFIPWGVGGLLYISIVNEFDLNYDADPFLANTVNLNPFLLFWMVYGTTSIILFFVRYSLVNKSTKNPFKKFEFSEVNQKTYFYFALPFILSVLMLSLVFSRNYILIVCTMGIFAFIAEYLFGKMCRLFISKRLWDYCYYTFDNNHGTPLSIIPFALAGMYFWTIAEFLIEYFKDVF